MHDSIICVEDVRIYAVLTADIYQKEKKQMGEYEGIGKRAEIDSIVDYFMDGACPEPAQEDTFHAKAERKCEELLDKIDQEYMTKSRDNKEICEVLGEFYSACQSISFKAGLAAGFQISKNLGHEYWEMKGDEVIKNVINSMSEKMDKTYADSEA